MSTTALVAAGALAAPMAAGEAQAAEPLALSIGGYLNTGLQFTDQDDGVGEPGFGTQDTSVHTDGEVQFTAKTTLDNGIEVRARIEYEAQNQGAGTQTVDERYVDFSGDFGIFRIGSDDPVTSPMHYQAPVGAFQMGVNTPTFAVPNLGVLFTAAGGSYPTTYADWSADAGGIMYYSPRIQGFQLGLSYQPDGTRSGIERIAFLPGDNDQGGQEDVVGVAVNYVNSFNGIDVAASVGYLHGSSENDNLTTTTINAPAGGGPLTTTTTTVANVFDDRDTWNAGINIGFSGFTVGGSFRQDNNGLSGNFDQTVWDVGITYATGPWTVGVTYLQWEQEQGTASDLEIDGFTVGGTYNLGPGVDVWAGVKWLDADSNLTGAAAAAQDNEAVFGMIGTSVSF